MTLEFSRVNTKFKVVKRRFTYLTTSGYASTSSLITISVLFDLESKRIVMLPRYLLIKQCILREYRELSGIVKLPSQIAT